MGLGWGRAGIAAAIAVTGTLVLAPGASAARSLKIADANGIEQSGSLSFEVTLSKKAKRAVEAKFETIAGSATAGSDFRTVSGPMKIAKGKRRTTIEVPMLDDTLDEPDETFEVRLSKPRHARIADGTGLGTIMDDDSPNPPAPPTPPTISVADASPVLEGNAGATTVAFTVTLSAPASGQVTVDYQTAAGSATSGTDYDDGSGTLTFSPQDTSEQILVDVNGDLTDEPDESFDVDLSNPQQATIADGHASATITDDDPMPTISIADATPVAEGNSGTTGATFTVSLSGPSSQQITVDYTTGNATAQAPGDYTAASGTVTFAPLDTSEQILVDVNGDVTDEPDESFGVDLSNPQQATIADGHASATITDDDPAPTISIADATPVTEGDSGTTSASFTVSLSGPSSQQITVDYATAERRPRRPWATTPLRAGRSPSSPQDTSEQIVVSVNGDRGGRGRRELRRRPVEPPTGNDRRRPASATITDDDPDASTKRYSRLRPISATCSPLLRPSQ